MDKVDGKSVKSNVATQVQIFGHATAIKRGNPRIAANFDNLY